MPWAAAASGNALFILLRALPLPQTTTDTLASMPLSCSAGEFPRLFHWLIILAKREHGGASPASLVMRLDADALTNAFREFWPDIAVHVLHRHP